MGQSVYDLFVCPGTHTHTNRHHRRTAADSWQKETPFHGYGMPGIMNLCVKSFKLPILFVHVLQGVLCKNTVLIDNWSYLNFQGGGSVQDRLECLASTARSSPPVCCCLVCQSSRSFLIRFWTRVMWYHWCTGQQDKIWQDSTQRRAFRASSRAALVL